LRFELCRYYTKNISNIVGNYSLPAVDRLIFKQFLRTQKSLSNIGVKVNSRKHKGHPIYLKLTFPSRVKKKHTIIVLKIKFKSTFVKINNNG
jgi:hypothetical protein